MGESVSSTPLATDVAREYFRGILKGLEYLHGQVRLVQWGIFSQAVRSDSLDTRFALLQGIIHRDIK